MTQNTTDKVVDAAAGLTPRQMAVAAMALLDQSGISARVFENIAKVLIENIDDGIEYEELEGETYEEACVRVAAEEKRLDDEINLRREV